MIGQVVYPGMETHLTRGMVKPVRSHMFSIRSFAPDSKFVSAWFREVKSATTRE